MRCSPSTSRAAIACSLALGGCAVRGAQKYFVCPCHGSVFDLAGNVKLDPAKGPLTALSATFDGTTVAVKT